MKRRSVLLLLTCGMLTFGMMTGNIVYSVHADTAKDSESETTSENNAAEDTGSSNQGDTSESAETTEKDTGSEDKKTTDSKSSDSKTTDSKSSDSKTTDSKTSNSKKSDSTKSDSKSSDTSESSQSSNTKTVKTATKSSNSSSKSSASSKTDSNGNTLLMTDSQRRSKFRSRTNPKRGTKPANAVERPANGMYLYGDFGTYNSYHSENGLGGTPIYLIGTIKDIEKVAENSEGYKAVLMVDDCDGYQWYIRFNVGKADYDTFKKQFMGKSGYIYGIYSGYSGVAYRPMMDMSLMVPYDDAALAAATAVQATADAAAADSAQTPAQSSDQTAAATDAANAGEVRTGNVSREMRSFLNSFESFMDVYVNFMKTYKSDPANAMKMLNENASITQQYINYLTKAQSYLNQNLSAADAEYLAAALARIEKKSLEVTQ